MHVAGYVYSIWSTHYHFPYRSYLKLIFNLMRNLYIYYAYIMLFSIHRVEILTQCFILKSYWCIWVIFTFTWADFTSTRWAHDTVSDVSVLPVSSNILGSTLCNICVVDLSAFSIGGAIGLVVGKSSCCDIEGVCLLLVLLGMKVVAWMVPVKKRNELNV